MAIDYKLRPISVDDYHRMGDAGIFDPDERVELLDGELIAVPPMGSPHAGGVGVISRLLFQRFGLRTTIRVQLPIVLPPWSEPEPDFAVVPLHESVWRTRHPQASDVLLLIEVCASSREFDLRRKAPIYGRAGVREFWVVDLIGRQVVVHRDPCATGYALTFNVAPDQDIAPLAFPSDSFEVAGLLGS